MNETSKIKRAIDSDGGHFLISVFFGVVLTVVSKRLNTSFLWDAIFSTLLTYVAIYIIRNPYGKFNELTKKAGDTLGFINTSMEDLSKKLEQYDKQLENLSKEVKQYDKQLEAVSKEVKQYDEQLKDLSNLIVEKKRKNGEAANESISILLKYLSEESYGKCSNHNNRCTSCSHYKSTCDGLFRTYLYQDCFKLASAIDDVKTKKAYRLDTDISFYHTLAIEQLKHMEGNRYRVIQPLIKSGDMVYDKMDIDFLKKFIDEIFIEKEEVDGKMMPTYAETVNFEVHWLFVGTHDAKTAKNNYGYLIEELCGKDEDIRYAFKFKTIKSEAFKRNKRQNLKIGETKIDEYYTDDPSLGIFGNSFVFVDAKQNEEQHGTMYAAESDMPNIISFFEKLWSSNETKDISLAELAVYTQKEE